MCVCMLAPINTWCDIGEAKRDGEGGIQRERKGETDVRPSLRMYEQKSSCSFPFLFKETSIKTSPIPCTLPVLFLLGTVSRHTNAFCQERRLTISSWRCRRRFSHVGAHTCCFGQEGSKGCSHCICQGTHGQGREQAAEVVSGKGR